ncbi:hypothetical protein QNI16_19615 [Cytophagaceae bacterium YF14B1]|uniref:Uncharacterized protein n=1 Tax=Xanthocytophaga flava TaxID=3048013 RepID=A0AAE3U9X5_9BACT|nr:hypothetical protein [Xanthocytophaga flavus]MDJ1482718.1 hypothetical protein [Xanthocytophaga flavus]
MSEPRFITLEEAFDLLANSPRSTVQQEMVVHLEAFAEFVEDESSRIVLYEGDITLRYLAVKDDIVIVNGNLTVTGVLEDCLEVNISLLLVLGNVTTTHLFTFSQICIAGNLTVSNAIVADSTCDYSLDVEGDLKAHLIIESGHWFDIKGNIMADYIYGWHSSKERKGLLEPNLTEEDFMEEINDDGRLELGTVMQYLMKNQPVLRNAI